MGSEHTPDDVAHLLDAWTRGDGEALNRLVDLLYIELHRLAHAHMRRERSDHTLQTTAIVNELYMRLAAQRQPSSRSRAQFFGVSAHLIRRVLVDYARSRRYAKRGGGAPVMAIDDDALLSPGYGGVDVLALDDALERLGRQDERKARIVESRYFGGMTIDEIAQALDIAPATVSRDWSFARAWLRSALRP
jgi:RNA polymerase sigma factor (TIGR02999 family)